MGPVLTVRIRNDGLEPRMMLYTTDNRYWSVHTRVKVASKVQSFRFLRVVAEKMYVV